MGIIVMPVFYYGPSQAFESGIRKYLKIICAFSQFVLGNTLPNCIFATP